jgi:hypothetical protein
MISSVAMSMARFEASTALSTTASVGTSCGEGDIDVEDFVDGVTSGLAPNGAFLVKFGEFGDTFSDGD